MASTTFHQIADQFDALTAALRSEADKVGVGRESEVVTEDPSPVDEFGNTVEDTPAPKGKSK